MRTLLFALPYVALTFLCWGIYGPVLHEGQHDMGVPLRPSSLRPFICVGLAYFLIAVVVPIVLLRTKGEAGRWTMKGACWSFMAGAAGAIGALGIILAFKFRGNPVYVMPLVFGLAPVVNTFVTMWMTRTFRQANTVFFAGVIVVAVGAAGVLFLKPTAKNISVEEDSESGPITVRLTQVVDGERHEESWTATSLAELTTNQDLQKAYSLYLKKQPLTFVQWSMILVSIACTALSWGCYGPVLHKGQMKMDGSRLRPFLCVGLAYFVIAVLVPVPLLKVFEEPGGWTMSGTIWSLAAGGAGAVGALGIIMAFNFGGKPIFVMPLVFGGAPVVNTLVTIWAEGTIAEVTAPFYASLMLVIGGAVTVLIFAPRPGAKPKAKEEKAPQEDQKPEETAPSSKPEDSGEESAGSKHAGEAVRASPEEIEETLGDEDTMDGQSLQQ
jgi:hypothetical protein